MNRFSNPQRLRQLLATALLLWIGIACAAVPQLAAPSEPLQKQILVLVSSGPGRPGVDLYLRTMHQRLIEGGLPRLNAHIEYLDFTNATNPEVRRRVTDLLLLKYASVPVDLVVTFNPQALDFLLGAGHALAPGKPVMGVFAPAPGNIAGSGRQLLLQTPTFDFHGMMSRALELFPDTRHVIALTDANGAAQFLPALREQLAPWKDRVEIEDTSALGFEDALRRVAASPARSIVLSLGYVRDKDGKPMTTVDTSTRAARVANAPVFSLYDTSIGHGEIGGMLSEIEGDARAMAVAALDRLRGISRQSEPVARLPTAPVPYFDWQVIQRFGGDSEKLPATTKFINHPLTLWSQYRGYVMAGVLVILLLAGLVIALLVQRRRRAQAEKAMHASADKYRSIYENIQDVYVETTVDGTICEISPQIVALTRGRYGREDFLGKSASVFYADPERRAEYVRSLREQGDVRDFETTFQDRDGSPIHCSVSARLITDPAGQSERIVATLRDIGDRKRAEDAVHRLNAELEQRVVERTARLERANKQLETFTYSVAHDLKAPLRGIDGYGRLLLDEYADKLDDQGRQFLRNMREGTQKMNQLLDDLLVYSRLDFQDAPVEQLDLRELVHALLAREAEEVRARGVTISVGESMGTVVADREGLSMALRNLLGNALKFTRTTPKPLIEIGGKVEAGRCLLWVRDNGIGFDMKYHDQIFAIFQRLHRTEDYPGTGVGLAIVSKAMERMGGRTWAESQPGRGATFYLEMPGS